VKDEKQKAYELDNNIVRKDLEMAEWSPQWISIK